MTKHIAVTTQTHKAFNKLKKQLGMNADGFLQVLIETFLSEQETEQETEKQEVTK